MPLSAIKSTSALHTNKTIDLSLDSTYNESGDERLFKNTPKHITTSTPLLPSKYSSSFEKIESEKKLNQKRHENSALSFDILEFLENRRSVDDSTKVYRIKKNQDEEEQRFSEIRELEKEARERSKARLNRQILSEEYCRLRLELEGLILERPTKKDDFPGIFFLYL